MFPVFFFHTVDPVFQVVIVMPAGRRFYRQKQSQEQVGDNARGHRRKAGDQYGEEPDTAGREILPLGYSLANSQQLTVS
jgi:hypothetical protein